MHSVTVRTADGGEDKRCGIDQSPAGVATKVRRYANLAFRYRLGGRRW